jgi:hypothetical protein
MRNATRVVVSTFGAIMGVAGIEHGAGEILQGNVAPAGIAFLSWPDSELFSIMGGEPALTIVPNLLITGVLAIILSTVFLIWSTILVERNNAGLVMIPLAIAMLLFGGGFFPPVLAMGIGLVGTRINAYHKWWRRVLSAASGQLIGMVWRCSLGIGATCWLLLFPGTVLAAYLLGAYNVDAAAPNLVLWLAIPAFTFMLLAIFTGFARDSKNETGVHRAAAASW